MSMQSTGFEDTVFLLNLRIKMVRDTMRLNPPTSLFMEKCLDDVAFIDNVLENIAECMAEEAAAAATEVAQEAVSGAEVEVATTNSEAKTDGDGESEDVISNVATGVIDYASDTEWQFSQLLTEFLLDSNLFAAQASQTARGKIILLRDGSNTRRKVFEKFNKPNGEDEEAVVSPTELSILFGGS